MASVERYPISHNKLRSKVLAGALGASVLAAVGIHSIDENRQPELPVINGLHREYEVRPGDTVAGLLQEAFPDQDWRPLMPYIENQIPAIDREDHILRAGEIISFNANAKIGKLVDPSR